MSENEYSLEDEIESLREKVENYMIENVQQAHTIRTLTNQLADRDRLLEITLTTRKKATSNPTTLKKREFYKHNKSTKEVRDLITDRHPGLNGVVPWQLVKAITDELYEEQHIY